MCHAALDHTIFFDKTIDYCLLVCVVLDYKKDLFSVCEETASVVQWFTLGLYLKIAPYELERISVDYRFNREGLQRMLSAWLNTGAATWLSLVRALKKIGQSDLANQIAKKKGACVCVYVCT